MSSLKEKYEQYVAQMRRIQDINSTLALLHWDNEVNAPSKGASFRAQQIATLSATAHDWTTDKQLGELLQELYAQRDLLSVNEAKNVELSLELYNTENKLSREFVKAFSNAKSNAFRTAGDQSHFTTQSKIHVYL